MDVPHHMELGGEQYIQLTAKITDHEVNGAFRYKAWTHHRDRVLERLGGWQLIVSGLYSERRWRTASDRG